MRQVFNIRSLQIFKAIFTPAGHITRQFMRKASMH